MGWVKFDDRFPEHPKIARMSDSALALWVTSIAYANRNLTDGFIPTSVGMGQLRYAEGNPTPGIAELVQLGSWEPVEGGWMIHDYHDFQPSRGAVVAEREAAKARMFSRRSPEVPANNGSSSPEVPGRGSGLGGSGKSKVSDADFARFWAIYPRRGAKRAARTALDRAVSRAAFEEILAGAERYRDDPYRTPEYTALPTTWLNQDRWADDPLPSRGHRDLRAEAERLMG